MWFRIAIWGYVCPSVCPSVYPSIGPCVNRWFYPSVCLSVDPLIYDAILFFSILFLNKKSDSTAKNVKVVQHIIWTWWTKTLKHIFLSFLSSGPLAPLTPRIIIWIVNRIWFKIRFVALRLGAKTWKTERFGQNQHQSPANGRTNKPSVSLT